jgi:Type IV secretion system pilin
MGCRTTANQARIAIVLHPIMKNKRYIAIFLAALTLGAGLMIFAPHLALADTPAPNTSDQYGINATAKMAQIDSGNTDITQVVGTVIKGALGLVGVVFLILMIYAGYLWMIARGNTEKVERSLDTIKAAIIGIIIVALAYAITDFVINQVLAKNSAPTTSAATPQPQ